ncbi:MAG: PPOX class F420-dependent oxidoreductase [Thermomicrobiales bacterium]
MPKGTVPEHFHDLLGSTALGHLATIGGDGRPQVNPVWFISDGARILLSIRPETVKYRNLRANPAVAMSILDPKDPFRYLEMRGDVAEFELYENVSWVNELARKYTGADFTGGVDGEQRYKVTFRVDSWTGQG